MHYIGVIGAGVAGKTTEQLAYEVGKAVAKAGAVLVCGGLGGVMHEAAHGANQMGGTVIGLLPSSSRVGSSDYLSYSIPTGLGEGRNVLIARSCDALIAIDGEYGTLSEIALALKIGKPVIGLNTWTLSKKGKEVEAITLATDPLEAVNLAIQAAKLK
ncbi:MAG: TIGR00725 family protein [Actinobacteria bacterium]|nr:MAG: TIGR00725 family protein [Actinomycetota bacterium]